MSSRSVWTPSKVKRRFFIAVMALARLSDAFQAPCLLFSSSRYASRQFFSERHDLF
jgi:hypothetical protein